MRTIKDIIDAERWEAGDHMLASMPSVEHNAALKRIADAVLEDEAALMRQVKLWADSCKAAEQRIAELEEQNLNMMALFRSLTGMEFNRDECWEIIKKYGGEA